MRLSSQPELDGATAKQASTSLCQSSERSQIVFAIRTLKSASLKSNECVKAIILCASDVKANLQCSTANCYVS
ncbi:hypothetical protein D918_00592 [Trichuris suis]|nr:hypothetical protein D918_00592 [Trichuris suis]